MKKINYLYLGIVLIVLIGMINPFLNKWKTGWGKDKDKICLPYTTQGTVFVYEGSHNCSNNQITKKEKFIEFYCKEYDCYPVLKNEEERRKIYQKFIGGEDLK